MTQLMCHSKYLSRYSSFPDIGYDILSSNVDHNHSISTIVLVNFTMQHKGCLIRKNGVEKEIWVNINSSYHTVAKFYSMIGIIVVKFLQMKLMKMEFNLFKILCTDIQIISYFSDAL